MLTGVSPKIFFRLRLSARQHFTLGAQRLAQSEFVHVVSRLHLQKAPFQLSITVIIHSMAHYRLDRQIFGENPGMPMADR
jgi:hypothetical protein